MDIGGREIANGFCPYIVAEISGNHNGSLNNALTLIVQAKKAGADAVKFQAYTPDTITLNCNKPDFIIQDGLWKGKTLFQLYAKAHTPMEWLPKLFAQAKREHITAFASVFDPTSVEILQTLDCPAYKIASFEITDIPLIQMVAKTGKPIIISTGLASSTEVVEADIASDRRAAFLHCTSEYPGTVDYADLGRMGRIKDWLGRDAVVGLSDHTAASDVLPIAATAMHCAIIEKHLKLAGDTKSEDKEFSLDPNGFREMVAAVKLTYEAMKLRSQGGNPSVQLRRSLYAVTDIAEGEVFDGTNIRSIRPGYGMAPKHLPKMLGKVANKAYRRGDRIV
jgi:pseudaminic acid synthase